MANVLSRVEAIAHSNRKSSGAAEDVVLLLKRQWCDADTHSVQLPVV
jgi:hypothetical protein